MGHALHFHIVLSRLVFVVHLSVPSFQGQSQAIGTPRPIVAFTGDNIILPCHLEPAVDASGMTVEWARPDLDPRFVYVWRDGVELEGKKHPSYKGRTSLSLSELKHGEISLNLSQVKLSDEGRYRCFVPSQCDLFAELVVGSVSSPLISLIGINTDSSGVVLQCVSEGWYPEPEVLWLDAEGNLLSAGPTETVRGPDDLYTVSSRVTVEKRHSNRYTCRVQQRNINQTRETQIHISADFFTVLPGSDDCVSTYVICLVVLLLFSLAVAFIWWKGKKSTPEQTVEPESLMEGDKSKERDLIREETTTRKQTKIQHL